MYTSVHFITRPFFKYREEGGKVYVLQAGKFITKGNASDLLNKAPPTRGSSICPKYRVQFRKTEYLALNEREVRQIRWRLYDRGGGICLRHQVYNSLGMPPKYYSLSFGKEWLQEKMKYPFFRTCWSKYILQSNKSRSVDDEPIAIM